MIAIAFAIFIGTLQLAVTVNAFVRSLKERFSVGWIGAIARAILLIAGGAASLRLSFASMAPTTVAGSPDMMRLARVSLISTVCGPALSFGVLWLAHRRKRHAPLVDEERLGRPFDAWLPVALFDAAFVVMSVFARLMADPF